MPDVSEQLLKEISKEFGEDILVGAQEVVDGEQEILSVSPSLDIGLGGGVPKGTWGVIGGKPKVGKTTTILSFAANCQKAGMFVYYHDVENRLKKKNILGAAGLDYSPKGMRIIRSRPPDEERGIPAKILTAQDHLRIAEMLLQSHPNVLVIFDSFSLLLDAREADGGIGTETRGGGAKLLAQFCRQMAPVVPIQKSIVLGVVHIMANTSGFGAALMEKSGNAVQYQMDWKLRAKGEVPWTTGGKVVDGKTVGGKIIGQKVTWEVTESALGAPGRVVESYIRYGIGVDQLYELFILGEQLGLIEKSGSWYNLTYLGDTVPEKQRRAQGGEKAYQLLKDNPTWAENLRVEINKVLGVNS